MTLQRTAILLFGVALLLLILVETNKPKPIDWSESYSSLHKIPRGAWIMHDLIGQLFPDQPVRVIDKTLYGETNDDELELDPSGSIVMINRALDLSRVDTRTLLRFVDSGGHALLAAGSFHGPLTDSLGIGTDGETMALPEFSVSNDSIDVTFTAPSLKPARPYRLPRRGAVDRFTAFDGETTTVLERVVEVERGDTSVPATDSAAVDSARSDTTNSDLIVTAIRVRRGKGAIILSTLPHSYTNYVLLSEGGLDRARKFLSYLPVGPVYWDEYNKPVEFARAGGRQQRGEDLGLDYILGRPPLRMAWYALLALGLLFVLFGARRRQRVIPIVRPPANTTVEFVETLGRLYHQSGSFKSIATKRIAALHDYIRTTLHLSTHRIDDELLLRIAERSGVDRARVAAMMETARHVERSIEIDGQQLLELSDAIEYFYRHSQR